MTAENPTPEEWTSWQLDKLRIYANEKAVLRAIRFELKGDLGGLEAIRGIAPLSPATSHSLQMAMHSLRDAVKSIDAGMERDDEIMEALEHIIITRDMSDRAFERELNRIRRERKGAGQ